MDKTTTLQATGDFPFTFFIEKAIPSENNGKLLIEGIASTVNVDHDNERMAKDALISMANVINKEGVPLNIEHSPDPEAIVGKVYEARVDDRNQLWIKAEIDPTHPSGPMIHASLKQGAKLGFSVGGRVKNAVRELVESTGKYIKTFYDVMLDHVALTYKPANYDAWLFAKSWKTKDEDVSPYYDKPMYREFMFENPKLDYIQQFAKSIPNSAWKKVDNKLIINKDMNVKKKLFVKDEDKKEDEMATKAEGDEKDTEDTTKEEEGEKKPEEAAKSYVSKRDFNKAMDMMAKGMNSITRILSKMDVPALDQTQPHDDKSDIGTEDEAKKSTDGAMDQVNPDETKEDISGQDGAKKHMRKDRDGQDDSAGNGDDETGERESKKSRRMRKDEMSAEDKDETTKDGEDEKKPTDETTKDGDDMKEDETTKDGSDEKNPEDMDKDGDDEKKPDETMKDGDDEKKPEESMKSMRDAIGRIYNLTKRTEGHKVTKSANKVAEIDAFAVVVASAFEKLSSRFEKSRVDVPGFKEMLIDVIRNDEGIQTDIQSMLRQPGFKKSVSMGGIPFVTDPATGKRFALVMKAGAEETVKKSMAGKTFKDVYKSKYSGLRDNSQE